MIEISAVAEEILHFPYYCPFTQEPGSGEPTPQWYTHKQDRNKVCIESNRSIHSAQSIRVLLAFTIAAQPSHVGLIVAPAHPRCLVGQETAFRYRGDPGVLAVNDSGVAISEATLQGAVFVDVELVEESQVGNQRASGLA